jgi:hypothetical protein
MADRNGAQQKQRPHDLHQSHGLASPRIHFPSRSSEPLKTDGQRSDSQDGAFPSGNDTETAPLLRGRSGDVEAGKRPNIPKLSRECLWS